ncbi:MAG: three-Cys-motif partner protein TcmP [Dehalococcoidia bacterium]
MWAIDPGDGLPASEFGSWSLEKHERLRKYVDAAHGARRSFAHAAYIDLYCGPGRGRLETGAFVDGSPLVAFTSAARHKDQFTDFFIADRESAYVRAAQVRLEARGARVHAYVGEARSIVDDVAGALHKDGLHFAFLDPYNLASLPFVVIERLAAFKRMDFLIHVSSMDLKRDLHNYLKPESGVLEDFAPGWRRHVDLRQRPELIRQAIFDHWRSLLISQLRLQPNERVEEVLNSKNTDLYWLVFVSRAKLAHKLWEAIANVSPQGRLI